MKGYLAMEFELPELLRETTDKLLVDVLEISIPVLSSSLLVWRAGELASECFIASDGRRGRNALSRFKTCGWKVCRGAVLFLDAFLFIVCMKERKL